jgi:hypothetical protein
MFTDEASLPENAGRRGGVQRHAPEPNEHEIAAMCAMIRAGWSVKEERARNQFSRWRLRSPHCPSDLQRLMSEAQ